MHVLFSSIEIQYPNVPNVIFALNLSIFDLILKKYNCLINGVLNDANANNTLNS